MYLFVHKQSLYDHLHHESSTSLSLRTFYRRSMGCRIALPSQGDHWSDCQDADKQPQKLRNSFSILFLIRKRAPEQGFGPAAHAVSARAVTKGNILSLDRSCLTVGTENSASLELALPNMALIGACPRRTASLWLPLGQCSCLLTLSSRYWQGQGAGDQPELHGPEERAAAGTETRLTHCKCHRAPCFLCSAFFIICLQTIWSHHED